MKIFTTAAAAEIAAGTAVEVGAVEISSEPPVRVWGGPWPMTIAGHEHVGIGDRGLVRATAGTLGTAAQNVTLELSGVDPDVLALLDANELRSAPTVIRRLIFNGAGTQLLDVQVFARGRVDQVTTEETVGGEAIIRVTIEGAARGLRRRGARSRTDADQRLVKANDGGLRAVAYAGQKTLYWGGKAPARAGAALGGVSTGLLSIFNR